MASSPIAIALRSVSPKCILTIGPLFGWLLRPPIQQEPSKSEAPSPSLFLFLFRSIRRPKRRVDGLPYAFRPFESSLQCPPHRRRYYLVGCYVSLSNGGHRRPVLHPSRCGKKFPLFFKPMKKFTYLNILKQTKRPRHRI